MKQLKIIGVFCLVIGTDRIFSLETALKTFLVMSVMFMLLQKLTFHGKFQICQISLFLSFCVFHFFLKQLLRSNFSSAKEAMWY
jgi:hypothetical protein